VKSTLRGPWLLRLGAFSSCGWRGLPGMEGSWAYFEKAVAVQPTKAFLPTLGSFGC